MLPTGVWTYRVLKIVSVNREGLQVPEEKSKLPRALSLFIFALSNAKPHRLMFKIQFFSEKWLQEKKISVSEQMCFLCVFRITFICFHDRSFNILFKPVTYMQPKVIWGRKKKIHLPGTGCGAAVMGQICLRLTGSGTSASTLLGNTAAMLCGLSPPQNTSLEICSRGLNRLTHDGSKLSQLLLLLSFLATEDKWSQVIFSYCWRLMMFPISHPSASLPNSPLGFFFFYLLMSLNSMIPVVLS